MVIRAGENVCAIFMHKKAPCRLFGTGAMAHRKCMDYCDARLHCLYAQEIKIVQLFKAG